MKEEEFVSVVLEFNILVSKECFDVIKYFFLVLILFLGFKQEKRGGLDRKQLCRFDVVVDYGWFYGFGKRDFIVFFVD